MDNNDISNVNWEDLYGKLEGENHEEVSFSMLCNTSTLEQNQAFPNNMVSHEPPPQTNLYFSNPMEGGGDASSKLQMSIQQSMIETGCLINPFGVPYKHQMMPPLMPTLSSWETIEGTSLVPQNEQIGQKRMVLIEGFEDPDEKERREKKKLKNRVSASKSRLKKLEHIKCLEEKVDKLRSDKAMLKGKIMFQKMLEAKESQMEVEVANKLSGLRRTLSC